jgi:hypothetical protein
MSAIPDPSSENYLEFLIQRLRSWEKDPTCWHRENGRTKRLLREAAAALARHAPSQLTTALADCPFCGGLAETILSGPSSPHMLWRVGCQNSSCIGRSSIHTNYGWTVETEAVRAWNARTASPAAAREEVARAMFEKAEQGHWNYARTDEQEYWRGLADTAILPLRATTPGGDAGHRDGIEARLEKHVARLAGISLEMSLSEWGNISNDILTAANLLRALPLPATPGGVAEPFKTTLTLDDLLILLSEECHEVGKAAMKCLRFGYDVDHGNGYGNNRIVLSEEIGDLQAIIAALPNLDHEAMARIQSGKIAKAEAMKALYSKPSATGDK